MLARHLAAVISGDGEQPVTVEFIVQRLQIIERRSGRLDDVAPAVIPPVLFQTKTRARVRNELPQSGSSRTGISVRLEGTFHYREEGYLQRHATCLEHRGDMVEIELGAAESALHVVRIRDEPVELLINVFLVRMILVLETGPDSVNLVGVLRRGEACDLSRLLGSLGLDRGRRLGRRGDRGLWICAARALGKDGPDRLLRDHRVRELNGRVRASSKR